MPPVFVDTNHYVAMILPDDDLHARAMTIASRILRAGAQFITSDAVLVELLAFFAEKGERYRRAAVQLVDALEADARTTIVRQTPELFAAGLNLYRRRPDKGYSLTDCMSMTICAQFGVTEVLTHDKHFEQEGFVRLLA